MKINWNKVCFLVLGSIALAGCCIASSLLLFTRYTSLQYISLTFTYLFGIYLVKARHKYNLYQ